MFKVIMLSQKCCETGAAAVVVMRISDTKTPDLKMEKQHCNLLGKGEGTSSHEKVIQHSLLVLVDPNRSNVTAV